MLEQHAIWIAIGAAVIAILYGILSARWIMAQPAGNERMQEIASAIQEGAGRAKLGGRRWSLRGPDMPAGAKVRVTGVDGTVLIVDRLPG